MTKLSEMHNAQINMMVCKKLGLGLSSYARIITQDDATILLDDNKTLVDYCNNWSDAGPIILKNCISLVWDCAEDGSSDWWNAFDRFDDCRVQYQSNPLRAAMIVFLEMHDK